MIRRGKQGDFVTGLQKGGLGAGQGHRPFVQILHMFRRAGGGNQDKRSQAVEERSGH
jgi:hypothetical protein